MKKSKYKAHMNLARKGLLDQIDEKYELLSKEPLYQNKLARDTESALKYLSDLSLWCNHADGFREDVEDELKERNQSSDYQGVREISAKGEECIRAAWSYLRGAVDYSKKDTARLLSPNLLLHLAASLDKENDSYRSLDEEIVIFEPEYTAPPSAQVQSLIEGLCNRVAKSKDHPVNKSIYTHLSIVAIQPFRFAHKRLGRLLGDSILKDSRLPPAIIYPGEIDTYYNLLRPAVIGWANGSSIAQVPFYDYIAGKVNMRLDRFIDCISGLKEKELQEKQKQKKQFGKRRKNKRDGDHLGRRTHLVKKRR